MEYDTAGGRLLRGQRRALTLQRPDPGASLAECLDEGARGLVTGGAGSGLATHIEAGAARHKAEPGPARAAAC